MSSARIMMELPFNIAYLIVIYLIVIMMTSKLAGAAETAEKNIFKLVRNAFLFLAIGDTGHVGFRVVSDMLPALKEHKIIGFEFTLIGFGNFTTALTVTVFYMLMLEVWRRRFDRGFTPVYYLLFGTGIVRLALFPFAGNQWGNTVPPLEWSLYRNIPLMVQGIGLAVLMLRDSRRAQDRTFYLISLMIFMSFAFYLPVILFVQRIPMIGMLMIPKTCAYSIIAGIGYKRFCNDQWDIGEAR